MLCVMCAWGYRVGSIARWSLRSTRVKNGLPLPLHALKTRKRPHPQLTGTVAGAKDGPDPRLLGGSKVSTGYDGDDTGTNTHGGTIGFGRNK